MSKDFEYIKKYYSHNGKLKLMAPRGRNTHFCMICVKFKYCETRKENRACGCENAVMPEIGCEICKHSAECKGLEKDQMICEEFSCSYKIVERDRKGCSGFEVEGSETFLPNKKGKKILKKERKAERKYYKKCEAEKAEHKENTLLEVERIKPEIVALFEGKDFLSKAKFENYITENYFCNKERKGFFHSEIVFNMVMHDRGYLKAVVKSNRLQFVLREEGEGQQKVNCAFFYHQNGDDVSIGYPMTISKEGSPRNFCSLKAFRRCQFGFCKNMIPTFKPVKQSIFSDAIAKKKRK